MQNVKDTLWSYGISGDNSIISIIIKDYEDINIIYDVIKAHEYWKTKGIVVDLVVINKEGIKYEHPIWDSINDIIDSSHLRSIVNKNGGVYLIRGEVLNAQEYANFMEASNIIFENGEFNMPTKIYESNDSKFLKDRVMKYFNSTSDQNVGVMFAGEKGTGNCI